MSRQLLAQIVAELAAMHSQLEIRADRLRQVSALMKDIEAILEKARWPPAAVNLGQKPRPPKIDES